MWAGLLWQHPLAALQKTYHDLVFAISVSPCPGKKFDIYQFSRGFFGSLFGFLIQINVASFLSVSNVRQNAAW